MYSFQEEVIKKNIWSIKKQFGSLEISPFVVTWVPHPLLVAPLHFLLVLQKDAAYEKYENRVQELMHEERQQERKDTEAEAKRVEMEIHKVKWHANYRRWDVFKLPFLNSLPKCQL